MDWHRIWINSPWWFSERCHKLECSNTGREESRI
jgi:hypothetical protein